MATCTGSEPILAIVDFKVAVAVIVAGISVTTGVSVTVGVGVKEGKGVTVFVGVGDSAGTDVADGDEVASSNLVAVDAAAAATGVDRSPTGSQPTRSTVVIIAARRKKDLTVMDTRSFPLPRNGEDPSGF